MDLLLDTHILLWWLDDNKQLSDNHRRMISENGNDCYISAATVWEISIKQKLGKLVISDNWLEEVRREGFLELAATWEHCSYTEKLPLFHNDPFDRLLIAQAILEQLTLISVDELIRRYDVALK